MSDSTRLASVMGALALAACGGSHDVDPTLISGGGVTDPGIDGEANVYVIDEPTGDPIEGATVYVGTVTGDTDTSGLFVAAGVSGPQQITVIADGYVSTTWVGVDGANVTIPMDPEDESTIDIPQATLTGTITGFTDLPVTSGTAKVAFVGFSANNDDNDPANDLQQPNANPPPNACINTGIGTPTCDWSLITRTGPQTVFAFIGDFNLQSQAIAVDGFAYATGIDVTDGVDQDGLDLTIADDNELVTADLTLPDPPSGTTDVQSLVRVNLGDEGRLQLPQTEELTIPVPVLSLFDGSDYDVLAIASDPDDPDPQSIVFDREVPTVDGYTVSEFPALPNGIAVEDKVFTANVDADATVQIFNIENTAGETQWGIAFFDGTAEVTQPDEINLPSGTLVFRAQSIVIPGLDSQDFTIEGIQDLIVATSVDAVDFTN